MKNTSILYVEDDPNLAFITRYNLESRGYTVLHCEGGNQALGMFLKGNVHLCILDVMLPEMDGFTLASRIRMHDKEVPIIFLTVKSLLEDKITGLQTGADDYLTKPFHMEELILKIEVFLRRSAVKQVKNTPFSIGDFYFDFDNLLLKNGAEECQLTLKEAELLRFLILNKNKVIKREEILSAIWGNDDYFLGRSLDVFISRLRKYLSREDRIKIENIHSVGFRMNVAGE
jgi:DNA-binding response OmpR family regulator